MQMRPLHAMAHGFRCPSGQVGHPWSYGGSTQGAAIRMLLTSPGATAIPVPYTLTLSGGAPFLSAGAWEWAATLTGAGQVGLPDLFQHAC